MPPWKPDYNLYVGSMTDNLKEFCDSLFGANQQAFRNQFFNCTKESQLRELLADNKIVIPPTDDGTPTGKPIRIMVVDVQYARSVAYGAPIDPKNELFYLLVMPPVPTKYDPEMQAWESACTMQSQTALVCSRSGSDGEINAFRGVLLARPTIALLP